MSRLVYRLYQAVWSGADWLFPPICGGCGKRGQRWCAACRADAQDLGDSICSICGEPLDQPGICLRCRQTRPDFDALRSVGLFHGNLRNALHRLKYRRDLGLGESLSQALVSLLQRTGWQVELVCPVPLSQQRLTERGYNQAAVLAYPLALACGLPYRQQALRRVRETASQVKLSITARRTNVSGAFQAEPRLVAGRAVLLVDDVATTGATLAACSQALRSAGATHVYCLTLARAAWADNSKLQPELLNSLVGQGV